MWLCPWWLEHRIVKEHRQTHQRSRSHVYLCPLRRLRSMFLTFRITLIRRLLTFFTNERPSEMVCGFKETLYGSGIDHVHFYKADVAVKLGVTYCVIFAGRSVGLSLTLPGQHTRRALSRRPGKQEKCAAVLSVLSVPSVLPRGG